MQKNQHSNFFEFHKKFTSSHKGLISPQKSGNFNIFLETKEVYSYEKETTYNKPKARPQKEGTFKETIAL